MSVNAIDLLLYTGGLLVLFLTPGPVWVALIARTLGSGLAAAVPLAFGVMVGDLLWPTLAILGLSWLVTQFSMILMLLKAVAVVVFWGMGLALLRSTDQAIAQDSRLIKPGAWAGFIAGAAVIIGNPKAMLFYIAILPGFFDFHTLTALDMALIALLSASIPFTGNLCVALLVNRSRQFFTSPQSRQRITQISGGLLILVGTVIPFT